MKKINLKHWTILIYANGNNELAPEIWQSKLNIEMIRYSDNINVIMEIGREDKNLVKLLRPSDSLPICKNNWTGVRRYYLEECKFTLIKGLGKINMTSPKNLYEFIKWGIKSYPAKHYMLILGGHGFQLVGVMTDFTQDKPYIMGIPEMIKVINMIKKDTGSEIDTLVLDSCYFNLIEVIYELGKDKNHTVKTLLTYINIGPLKGMPYDKIIYFIDKHTQMDNLNLLITDFINTSDLNLIAFKINHNKLEQIKSIINSIAYLYLHDNCNKKTYPSKLLYDSSPKVPWYKLSKHLQKSLSSLIIHNKKITNNKYELIEIATMELTEINKLKLYYKFSFARNNYWTYLLSGKTLNDNINLNIKITLNPLPIKPITTLKYYISLMNPNLTDEAVFTIFDKLVKYKNWSY